MNRRLLSMTLLIGFALGVPSAGAVSSSELIVNGGFEAGLTGWTVTNQGSGGWVIDDAIGGTPTSSHATVGPASGASYAVSDQGGGGVHAIDQLFNVPSGPVASIVLSFQMFVNDWSDLGPTVNAAGLDHLAGPNQHARVDLMTAAASPLDTGAGVVANFYLSVDAGIDPHPYTPYSFDITSLVAPGGTYKLRFAEVDNRLWLNQGVDDVSILYTPVPEPATLAAMGLALLVAVNSGRRQFARPDVA
jgi:hypothetical protein